MIVEVTRYEIIKRKGNAENMFKEEILNYFSSPSYEIALYYLKQIADEYKKDSRCVVDWLSMHAFIVFWTDDMTIDLDTERWTFGIKENKYITEI